MDRLIFTANMAMSEYRLDRQNMTHELANISTTGFESVPGRQPSCKDGGRLGLSRFLPRASASPEIDLSPGPRILTGRPLDIALDGMTVLPVQAENGAPCVDPSRGFGD